MKKAMLFIGITLLITQLHLVHILILRIVIVLLAGLKFGQSRGWVSSGGVSWPANQTCDSFKGLRLRFLPRHVQDRPDSMLLKVVLHKLSLIQ